MFARRAIQQLLADMIHERFDLSVEIVNGDSKRASSGAANSTRREMIRKFRDSHGFDAIVLSPEVAGVGLTLVEANHVIHYGRWWNPATESQATDRAYRIGQTREVHVYYPIAKDPHNESTIFDEKLQGTIERSRQMPEDFLTPQPTEADLQQELLNAVLEDPLLGSEGRRAANESPGPEMSTMARVFSLGGERNSSQLFRETTLIVRDGSRFPITIR